MKDGDPLGFERVVKFDHNSSLWSESGISERGHIMKLLKLGVYSRLIYGKRGTLLESRGWQGWVSFSFMKSCLV